MRKLNHPNIIHLFEVHETENTIYMIMDYLEGGQLLEMLRVNRKVPEAEIVKIFIHILNGVAYLHENNIMHRDIKPDNILLNSDGEIKLCDFGLSGFTENSVCKSFVGCHLYMPVDIIY